jgi:hypothetical protein
MEKQENEAKEDFGDNVKEMLSNNKIFKRAETIHKILTI